MTRNCDAALEILVACTKETAICSPALESLERLREELAALAAVVVPLPGPEEAWLHAVNNAAKGASAAGHDVLILATGSLLFPDALAEMRRVAGLDAMIGMVSPRSNRTALCALPHGDSDAPACAAHDAFLRLSRHLPEFHFVPGVEDFCVLVSSEVLEEFGPLDETRGSLRDAVNDLLGKANRCGIRAALANHAYVYQSASPRGESPSRAACGEYYSGIHYEAEHLLTGLLPRRNNRCDLVFDLSSLEPYHNGTFEAAASIVSRAAEQWNFCNLYIMAREEALRFHGLDTLQGVDIVRPEHDHQFALAFHFGQPLSYHQFFRMSRIAVLNVWAMLDPIAWDCDAIRHPSLEQLWTSVFAHADGIVYISDFVAGQFHRRFRRRPGLRELACHLSLDARDYEPAAGAPAATQDYILVVGNQLSHKHLAPTVEALSGAFPGEKITVLGLSGAPARNVTFHAGGSLTAAEVDGLYLGARVVIFPSFYEGFGLPVMKGLGCGKPVLTRSIPALKEVREAVPCPQNIILYSSTRDLIAGMKEALPVWQPCQTGPSASAPWGWRSAVDRLGSFLEEVMGSVSFSGVLLPRLDHYRLLKQATEGAGGDTSSVPPRYRDRLVPDLYAAIRDRDTRIAQIYGSMSWKITSPLRKLAGVWLRRGKRFIV